MAKVSVGIKDTHIASTGRWIWKDETNTLEFLSHNPAADKQDKKRKPKAHDAAKMRAQDRVQSSVPKTHVRARIPRMNAPKSPRQRKDVVTIEDIKKVASEMMAEVETLSSSFDGLYKTEQFNDFLLHLLSYFHCFFEKMAQENKKNPMYIEPSLSEKKAYANACARLEVAQKLLGQSYCILVLGLGLEDQHHMICGRSRVSATYKDRGIFETFYTFCTFVVWITFRRKEFEVIKKEIGRMLRSDTFNPAIRVKYAPDEREEAKIVKKDDTKGGAQDEKLSPAQYRRLHPKRPAIKSIINQRSPAVVSILPSPKEEAHWLFKRTRPLSPTSLGTIGHEDLSNDDMETLQMIQELTIDSKKFKVGILGEQYSMFNPMTLTPVGADNEDEENEGEEGEEKPSGEETAQEKTPVSERGVSRNQTAISHVTTEVYSDDED